MAVKNSRYVDSARMAVSKVGAYQRMGHARTARQFSIVQDAEDWSSFAAYQWSIVGEDVEHALRLAPIIDVGEWRHLRQEFVGRGQARFKVNKLMYNHEQTVLPESSMRGVAAAWFEHRMNVIDRSVGLPKRQSDAARSGARRGLDSFVAASGLAIAALERQGVAREAMLTLARGAIHLPPEFKIVDSFNAA